VDLGHKPVLVGVGWALNVKVAVADVVDGLIVKQDGDISVLRREWVDMTALETSVVVCKLTDAVKAQVKSLLANGVVTMSKVVGCIFLVTDELLRMEELAVGASPHLIDDSGFKVNKYSSQHAFPTWIPAWLMWIEMHSLMVSSDGWSGGGGAKWEKGEKALSHGDRRV
jgi:hypothetical protein